MMRLVIDFYHGRLSIYYSDGSSLGSARNLAHEPCGFKSSAWFDFCDALECFRLNSPAPLMDNWKVTDNSSINFHDVFFFIFCYNLAKNEEKHVMEIYG